MRVPALAPTRTPEPLSNQPIDVVIAGGWRLAVRTDDAPTAEDDVHLEPVLGGVTLPGGLTEVAATLEWRSARGLVRREGVLRAGPRGFTLSGAREAVVMQRRNFARVRAAVRVLVEGAEHHEVVSQTVDLSVGGMLVEHAASLEVGERVRFALILPDGDGEEQLVRGEGEVVRATPFGHRAIQFDPWERADEQLVARYVFQQEREGRSTAAYV